jgi:hypothetical protein
MSDENTRQLLAREIMFKAVDYWIERYEGLWEFSFAVNGDVLVIYQGTHKDGSGGFSCRYNLLPALEKILVELEKRVGDLTFDAPRTDGAGFAAVSLREIISDDERQMAVRATAETAAIILIGQFASKFVRVMPEAIDDVLLMAEAGVRHLIVKAQNNAGLAYVEPDFRPALKERGEASARQRIEGVKNLIGSWKHIQQEAKRGRRPEITKAKVRAVIAECRAAGIALAPKTVAEKLNKSTEGFRQWAISKGYIDAQHALDALSELPTNSGDN